MITFKSFFLALFCMVVATCSVPASAADAPFVRGEKIHYSVKQMGIKAGDAVLEFKGDAYLEGRKYTLVIFTAKGFNFYDEERIYLDPETLLPARVLRDLNIFGNKENIMEEYLLADGVIRVTKTVAGKTTVRDIPRKVPAENIYGFLYRARAREQIKVGKVFDLYLPTLDLKLKALKEVRFNAAGKAYQSVMITSVPSKYTIWFDLGPNKLPLRIAGSLGMSNTVMIMTGYEAK